MASGLFSSIQSLSTNLLQAIRGTVSTSQQQQEDPSSPLTDQHKSIREDLEKLSRMLTRIQAVQQYAEEREIHDSSVRLWLEELRGVAYQAKDVLDEFYYEVLRSIVESGDAAIEAYHRDGGTKRKFSEMYTSSSLASYSFTITKASIPDGMSDKIKGITERFEEISNARRDLHLREEDGTQLIIGPQIRPPTSSHVDERAIFGREEEKEKIISVMNTSNGPDFVVLPIVGMGGLGKTTLAKLVYNDLRIHGLFNKRCWVSVSEDFDLVRLTKAIVESVSNSPCEFSELSKLQDVLKEKIIGLSLFLVLDDVWNEKRDLWETFRVGFLGAKVVRILTTTRNTSVAKIMQTTSPFPLCSLPEENCWSLFKRFAFGTTEASENSNLHKIGRGIVKKWKSSPLATKVLGGILHYEMEEEKWKEILESDISEIDETGEIMPALRLSYHKLPRHLKPCFLYLSMFPKGKRFAKNKVVRHWMAQGYINGNIRNVKTLEEIGSEYFNELQGRSLVECGTFNKYFLHDLIHDLVRSICQEAYRPILENNQIRTFVKENMNFNFAISSEIAGARVIQLRYSHLPNTLSTLKHLRYLSVKHFERELFGKMTKLPNTLCLLYNLQTLDLNCPYLEELPENIKNLINLRYFYLKSSIIQQLPESFFLLCNLHTLSLRYCRALKQLPRGIEQLTRLQILDLPESLIYMPSGIGKLTTLKPLSGHFSVVDHGMNGGLGELKDMNMLSELLCISGLINIGDVENSRNVNLASKPNLQKLILNFKEDHRPLFCIDNLLDLHLYVQSSTNANNKNNKKLQEVVLQSLQPHGNLTRLAILNYGGRIFPSWLLIPLLPKLTTLILSFCTEPNFLPQFGQLPSLKVLYILGNIGVRNIENELSTYSLLTEYGSSKQPMEIGYPSLQVLLLRNMLNLVEWQAHESDFPCLKKLVIENCPKLWKITTIPQEVKEVTFKNCPNLKFLTCASEIEKLEIHDCGFREIMFAVSEKLIISSCVELISINWRKEAIDLVSKVSFECCPNLELIAIPVGTLKLKIHECGIRAIIFRSICNNLTISNCVELISINWSDWDLNPVEKVSFECCPKLVLPTIQTGIKTLNITYCGIQEIIFPLQSSIQMIDVIHCPLLTSIHWVKRETLLHTNLPFEDCPELKKGLKNVRISYCPILQFPVNNVLQYMTQRAEIYNCPRMDLGKRYVYQSHRTMKVLNIIGNNEICLSANNSSIPLLKNPFTLFLTKEGFLEVESFTPSVGVNCQCIILNLPSLVTLEIYRCRNVISVTGLENLSNLKRLSISYCPELCSWNDKTLPLSLKSLKLNSCDKLRSLPLLSVQNHPSILKVLVIKKCPRLVLLEGFHGLMKLKTVELLHCRNISISSATENLQFTPHNTIGDCPLMRDWCQRNNINYDELNLIDNSQDDREDDDESAEEEITDHLIL